MPQHLNNSQLLVQFVAWRESPQFPAEIPPAIIDAFISLVDHLAWRPNFAGYSYINDMKAQALMQCCIAAPNFDPGKSRNPFGYFTTCSWFAFTSVIRSEQKQRGRESIAFSEFTAEKAAAPDTPAVLGNATALGNLTARQLGLVKRMIDNPPARPSPSTTRELRRLGCVTPAGVKALVERERRRLVVAGVL